MKVLFIAPRLPLPADTGGKIRTLNILRQIAKRTSVHLVCFSFNESDDEYAESLEQEGISVTLVAHQPCPPFRKAVAVFTKEVPVSLAAYDAKKMEEVIRGLITEHDYTVVHFDHVHTSHYRHCCQHIPGILDEHNVEYRILERCAVIEKSWIKRWIFANQARKMKTVEARMIKEFTHVLTCSQEDKNILSGFSNGETSFTVIPNGVDTQYFKSSLAVNSQEKAAQKPQALVFTGSMDWLPNTDAVVYFCREILPLIWQKKTAVQFYIIGKNPTSMVQRLAQGDERIIVTGRVPDVREYIERSQIFVVPIRIGGGTRLKILEAMSMGRAIVSTMVGAEGILCTSGRDILIADQPQDFSDQILNLLDDEERRLRMGEAGRALVCEHYDWDKVGEKLWAVYQNFF